MRAMSSGIEHAWRGRRNCCVQVEGEKSTQRLEHVEYACNVAVCEARMDRDEQLLRAIHSLEKTF